VKQSEVHLLFVILVYGIVMMYGIYMLYCSKDGFAAILYRRRI